MELWDKFVESILTLDHFRNLVMLMMITVVSVKEYKSQAIDEKYMSMVTFALGYYFGTSN